MKNQRAPCYPNERGYCQKQKRPVYLSAGKQHSQRPQYKHLEEKHDQKRWRHFVEFQLLGKGEIDCGPSEHGKYPCPDCRSAVRGARIKLDSPISQVKQRFVVDDDSSKERNQ